MKHVESELRIELRLGVVHPHPKDGAVRSLEDLCGEHRCLAEGRDPAFTNQESHSLEHAVGGDLRSLLIEGPRSLG